MEPWLFTASGQTMVDRNQLLVHMDGGTGFRLPTENDLVPGKTMRMVDIKSDFDPRKTNFPVRCGTKITIDEVNPKNKFVYYYCEGFERRCFVPIKDFVAEIIAPDPSGPDLTTLYAIEK